MSDMDGTRHERSGGAESPAARARKAAIVQFVRQASRSDKQLALVPSPRTGAMPLSYAQERLWFLQELDPADTSYNVCGAVDLEGELNEALLEKSLREIVRRHETLRTRIEMVNGAGTQKIDSPDVFRLQRVNLEHMEPRAQAARIQALEEDEGKRPFDLRKGPVCRGLLVRRSVSAHVLLITMHHIVSDAWSMGVFVRELGALYSAWNEGREPSLPPLAIQYGDFAIWQRQWLQGEVLQKQLDYWVRQLAGSPSLLELPADRVRPACPTHEGAIHQFALGADIESGLRELAKQEGATLFMVLLGAFQVLLWRLSGQEDVVVGTPIAGRMHAQTEALIGFFVNTLALRSRVNAHCSFRQHLASVKQMALEAYAHQDVPFAKVVQELRPPRDLSHQPIVQVMFGLAAGPPQSVSLRGLELHARPVPSPRSKFDLTLTIQEGAGGLKCEIEYATELFDAQTIANFAGCYHALLRGILSGADLSVARLPMLDQGERRKLLVQLNDTAADYPAESCLHSLICEQVARTPDIEAVSCCGSSLTYRELDSRANQLARYLIERGAGPDVIVGICLERSVEMLIAMLAVLKAGSAYLPLDPAYPADRRAFMLADARAPVLITNSSLTERVPSSATHLVILDEVSELISRLPVDAPSSEVTAGHLAYVIYTSGSTGRPKGVMVPHCGVVNLYSWYVKRYGIGVGTRTLVVSSFAFDLTLKNLLGPLLTGGAVVLADSGIITGARLLELLAQERVSLLNCAPSQLYPALEALTSVSKNDRPHLANLSYVILGGEPIHTENLQALCDASPNVQLINSYGPTEITDVCIDSPFDGRDAVVTVIGRPVANTQAYILDKWLQPVPAGVDGELYIGGHGVARGYLGDARFTARSFIASPFMPGQRLYRTGDRARYRHDGNIVFQGRVDGQVKVRGIRVETGEVESVLRQHPAIAAAVVVAVDEVAAGGRQTGAQRLAAYCVAAGEAVPRVAELRKFMQSSLPEHMVPSAYHFLSALPSTPSGKVDRRALSALPLSGPTADAEFAKPRGPAERVLCGLWAQLLGSERVGINDSFFELGGHSVLAMQAVSRIRDVFQIEVPLRSLFEAPSVAGLVADITSRLPKPEMLDERASAFEARDSRASTSSGPTKGALFETLLKQKGLFNVNGRGVIPRVTSAGPWPLSYAQERLWFLHQLEPHDVSYNICGAVDLEGVLDERALERSLRELVRRHESLRTHIAAGASTGVQHCDAGDQFELRLVDCAEEPEESLEASLSALMQAEGRHCFDLSSGPLFRALLIRRSTSAHVLTVTMHHVISDGWSMAIFIRELGALYSAFVERRDPVLPALPIRYVDYAVWQRQWLQGELLQKQLDYWKSHLAGAPSVLELPTDRLRPARPLREGGTHEFLLSPGIERQLHRLATEQNATLFMVLLGTFQLLLARLSGQRDVVVGTPIAGRMHAQTEGLIGFFVNTLALRARIDPRISFRKHIDEVRQAALGGYANQDVPFATVVQELRPQRNLTHQPIFQVMFAMQNVAPESARLAGLRVRTRPVPYRSAKFDLTLTVLESSKGLECEFEYATELFDADTIANFAACYRTLLNSAVAEPEKPVGQLSLLSLQAQRQILLDWNATAAVYPQGECLHQLVSAQAARTPDATAATASRGSLTYADLERRSNQLAHLLMEQGAGPDVIVGLCLERSLEMIVAMLGVLKAGSAYAPLDPQYPAERVAFMLEDARAPIVITQSSLVAGPPQSGAKVITLEGDWGVLAGQPEYAPAVSLAPTNLAYVIYTSGSTGRPKGVMLTHRGAVNLYYWYARRYGIVSGTRILVVSSFAFDLTLKNLLGPLTSGGTVVLAPSRLLAAEELLALLADERIHLLNCAPSQLYPALELLAAMPEPARPTFDALSYVVLGGEPIHTANLHALRSACRNLECINSYGPTEITDVCIDSPFVDDEAIVTVIGRPVANTQVYVLDERLQPVPAGVEGELYVGGHGVGRGYLRSPGLTAQRFLASPFTTGERLYRTGDRVCYRRDGRIVFLGRVDNQVKVRGFRIETGEIEATLQCHPGVRVACVVAATDATGGQRLVAYCVAASDPAPTSSELRRLLQERLPDYMVPSACHFLESLPLTPSGKVDRKSLAALGPAAPVIDTPFVAPRTAAERVMAGICSQLLGCERVGVDDDFFELGGHSVLATQAVSRIREIFQVELPLRTLFDAPTVGGLLSEIGLLHAEPDAVERIAEIYESLAALPEDAVQQMLTAS